MYLINKYVILSPDWELGGGEAIHCCWWSPLPINPTTAAALMMMMLVTMMLVMMMVVMMMAVMMMLQIVNGDRALQLW